ncbi:hypothetical protein B0F90DRAFT_1698461 [Multifurca ochricompacta]|uniref:Uncharacterized protein n=1 Tax=Multifurca ochricompacta TaxID=376703 RepID=A0AAD4QQS8_9AGAM|nr:hypothetical protein B0F90DRAFT_1698461 [Multifurca ochricompacta]
MADSFNILIDDNSPLFSYFPFPDTLSIPNFFAGWNPCFNLSACPTFPGQQGTGTSFHVTSRDGAAFSIQWWGNGIQLSGLATSPVTYDLQLDGQTNSSISPSTSGSSILATYSDLQPTNHTLSLIVRNPTNSSSALIGIAHALINVNSTSPNVTFSTTLVDDTSLPFTGHWSFLNDSSLSSLDSTYHTTSQPGDFVAFNFSGSAVTVFGFRDATSGKFSVRLDNDSVTLNGASSSKDATTLFFRSGLNDTLPHTLTITNEDNGLLAIGSINVTTAHSNSPNPVSGHTSHSSRGTVAAIIVAAVLGAVLLLITLFCIYRRRQKFGRILHRRRLFVPPNGNNHSKVLDIVRGPEVDDFDDMYEDKEPGDKGRHAVNNGSGSLSFTLDLPIQSRPSLPPSQRDYSGNSAQELPRSPTVSLGRTGTHARESSRGVPISAVDGDDNGQPSQPPSSDASAQATSGGVSPRDQETREHVERSTFELTPVVVSAPPPHLNVAASGPGTSGRTQPSFSFLDISASSRASSMRHTGPNVSSSSSSSGSMRRRSDEPFSPARRISLPFAMGYPRDPSTGLRGRFDLSGLASTNVEFPRFSLNIRPLPQIPQAAEVESSQFSSPLRQTVRPHTQSTPPLHVQTRFEGPQQPPRSVSVTTAPPISTLEHGNRAPHVVIHPSAHLRPHPRNSSAVSPTESVPVTVSDIHFRHSSDDEPGEPESRRTSAGVGDHPPPHPPLPQRSYASPFIMQKLFGVPASPPESAGGQFSFQSLGAGPSRSRDRDSPSGGSSTQGLGRSTL